MAVFSYRATSLDGAIIEGVIEAQDRDSAVERLKQNGVIPLQVAAPKAAFQRGPSLPFSRSHGRDLLDFTSQLSSLLGAGIPLDRCLSILSQIAESAGMRTVVESVLQSIRKGRSFSDALAEHPRLFSRVYVNMVRAGEAGGVLDAVLERLGEFLESMREVREHVVSAMIYPSVLVFTGGLSIAVLLTFVLPRFSVIFADLGTAIPLSAKLLLAFSSALRSYWWIFLAVPVLGALIFRAWTRTGRGRWTMDTLLLRLAGGIVVKLETARFSRTLGTLLQSGVPLLQSLSYAQDTISNRVIAASIDSVISDAREGKGIAAPMAKAAQLPRLALSMIAVGEETGRLDEMLLRIAKTYEQGLRIAIRRFMALFEPVVILGMAVIIGFIVITMLTAIFSIIELPF